MAVSIAKLERNARYLMGGVAILAALVAIAVKAGLVSPAPSYQLHSWYAKESHSGFEIISEFPDEAQCRSKVPPASACLSGKVLLEQRGLDAHATSHTS